ncbi:hypothetical protein [Methylobacterium sp. sgz302541]|uniref:hypothetical protein n=1 Tax=unclassified Methylobacterium TaxID=2615210 RepID=UPI003D32AE16
MVLPDEVKTLLASPHASPYRGDVIRWMMWRGKPIDPTPENMEAAIIFLLTNFAEFRTITDYRINLSGLFESRIKVYNHLPRTVELYIGCRNVGPGLIVSHGHGTIVHAESIGNDFFVNQNVTIGYDGKSGIPVIGDRVTIHTGAVVVGKITIGSDVTIGANAVVHFDVPSKSKVFAPRATIVTSE